MNGCMYERIYHVVRRIPYGRVATYGQIASLVDPPCDPRQVGWALAALREGLVDPPVPWQRVVNAEGRSSVGSEQIALLEEEGVLFDRAGRIDLECFGWDSCSWERFDRKPDVTQ